MKHSTYANLETRLANEQKKAVYVQFIIALIQKSPNLFFNVLFILIKLIKLIAETFFDKDGNRKTPWWAKVLGAFGIRFTKRVQDIGEEADKAIKELDIPVL